MQFISPRAHGFLDYIAGIVLILSPWLFGFAVGGTETWLPVIIGAGTILYSLFTDYDLGIVRVIPLRGHLSLDFAGGLILALSPWIFDFALWVWVPHLLFGLVEMGASVMTRTTSAVGPIDTRPLN